jgi:hypothetical protein
MDEIGDAPATIARLLRRFRRQAAGADIALAVCLLSSAPACSLRTFVLD